MYTRERWRNERREKVWRGGVGDGQHEREQEQEQEKQVGRNVAHGASGAHAPPRRDKVVLGPNGPLDSRTWGPHECPRFMNHELNTMILVGRVSVALGSSRARRPMEIEFLSIESRLLWLPVNSRIKI